MRTGFMLSPQFIILIAFTVEDLRQRELTNGLGHPAMLIGGIEEEESYEMQH